MKYRSDFSVEKLICGAQKELPTERLKILLLATMAGLRRNEIDKLEWAAFRWDKGIIRIKATRYFHPKSEDSVGDVEVDAELLEIFRGFRARSTGNFVIDRRSRRDPVQRTRTIDANDFSMRWVMATRPRRRR